MIVGRNPARQPWGSNTNVRALVLGGYGNFDARICRALAALRTMKLLRQPSCWHADLPAAYWHYACWWEWLGYPAFVAMIAICFLMIATPL